MHLGRRRAFVPPVAVKLYSETAEKGYFYTIKIISCSGILQELCADVPYFLGEPKPAIFPRENPAIVTKERWLLSEHVVSSP